MKRPGILIADGDKTLLRSLQKLLPAQNFELIAVRKEEDIPSVFRDKEPVLVVIGHTGADGQDDMRLVHQVRQCQEKVPIILIVKDSSEEKAIGALRAGVNDYFRVPFSHEELAASIKAQMAQGEEDLPGSLSREMIGKSKPIQEVTAYLGKVAPTDSTVLITGETGTGKELAAEMIHQRSPRQKNPFVCINCAALPESLVESEMFGYERGAFTGAAALSRGKFEQAEGGTVFLDEIADMSPFAQAKILRTVERKEVYRLGGRKVIPLNVRVTAATNQDPEQLLEEGTFREDLYYRLNVARVHLPPLRDRKEDIPGLVAFAIGQLNQRFGREVQGLSDEAMGSLLHYDWPGNVREMMNLLEAAFINLPCHRITFMDLPKPFRRRLQETKGMTANERDQVLSALFATNWNKSKAAQKLRWSRMTLYRKMAKYSISASLNSPEQKT